MLNLATYNNSPDRSTKSTLSSLNALQLLVNTGFQVLFHSPPGVLFTFPSRYFSTIGHQLVFSLGGWSPLFPTGFLVPGGTLVCCHDFCVFAYGTFTLCGLSFPSPHSANTSVSLQQPQPPKALLPLGLGFSAFARHYLRNHYCFLFLRVLRCFSSPRLPLIHYVFMY